MKYIPRLVSVIATALLCATTVQPLPARAGVTVTFRNNTDAYVYLTVYADRFIPAGGTCVGPRGAFRKDFLIVQGLRARVYHNKESKGLYGHCHSGEVYDKAYFGSEYHGGHTYYLDGSSGNYHFHD